MKKFLFATSLISMLSASTAFAGTQFVPPGGLPANTAVGTAGDTLQTILDKQSSNTDALAKTAQKAWIGNPTQADGTPGIAGLDSSGNVTAPVTGDVSAAQIANGSMTVQDLAAPNDGQTWSAKWERLVVNAGTRATLATVTNGPGYAQTINMALGTAGKTSDLSTVEYYVDGETTPSVTMRYGLLGTYGGYAFASKYVTCVGGRSQGMGNGCTYQLKVPYKKSLTIKLFNNSTSDEPIWGWVQGNYDAHQFLDRRSVLHSVSLGDQYTQEVTVQPLEEHTLLDVSGRGEFLGMQFFMDRHNNAAGADENCIEGNFRYYLDGHTTPDYESSGTEDYFGSAFEFMNAGYAGATGVQTPYATPQFGTFYNQWSNATGTSATDDQSSSFRWHYDDPVQFNTHLRVTWQCGDTDFPGTTATAAGIAAQLFYTTDK